MSSDTPHKTSIIIWDLDGTLLDSFEITLSSLVKVLPRHGFPAPTALELTHHVHGPIEACIRGLVGNIDEAQLAAVLHDFMEVDNKYIEDVDHHLFVDALTLAKRAHEQGIRQILVTNRPHGIDRGLASPRNIVQGSILCDYIDTVICGDEVDFRKPSPEVLGDLQDAIVPEETLVIGDQFVDAQLAGNLGARAVLVNRYDGPVAHLDQLEKGWQGYTTVLSSLHDVQL